MREIKFRVWDNKSQEYIKDLSNFWIRPDFATVFMEWRPDFDGETVFEYNKGDFVFEQYTGLKDITGKEIYENDIIKFIPDITFEKSCVWQNWGHVWINNVDGIGISYNHPRSENSDRLCDIITEYYSVDGHMKPILKYKIIGNEHQWTN